MAMAETMLTLRQSYGKGTYAKTVIRNAWSCYIATVVDFSINDDQLLNSIQ